MQAGAIASMLSALAGEAAADADELLRESDETSAYLRDSEGNFLADPAVPEERAEALYRVLSHAEDQWLDAEMATYSAYWSSPDDFDPDEALEDGRY